VSLARPGLGPLTDASLLVFCLAMLWAMHARAGGETIPYHLLFLVLTVVYGFRVWPMAPTIAVTLAVTLATGVVMYDHYRNSHIDAAELSEVPLMPALFLAMVWHARRRSAAQRVAQAMSDRHLVMLERERSFFRDTSHAIRTPVTIARGHLELARPGIGPAQVREDVDVALRQLDRMAVLSDRLLGLAQIDSGVTPPMERIHLQSFLLDVWQSWTSWDARLWEVSCPDDGEFRADPAWLGLAVDALIENAIHFTQEGGHISVEGRVTATSCVIRVSDDGPGIPQDDLDHVFERFWHRLPPNAPMGSGLGLAMAQAAARMSGGDVSAGNLTTGGAVFELSIPRLVVSSDRRSELRVPAEREAPKAELR